MQHALCAAKSLAKTTPSAALRTTAADKSMSKLLLGKNPHSYAWKPDNLPAQLSFKCYRLQIDIRNDEDSTNDARQQAGENFSRQLDNPAPTKKPRLAIAALRSKLAQNKSEHLQRLRSRIETPGPTPTSTTDALGPQT